MREDRCLDFLQDVDNDSLEVLVKILTEGKDEE